ncbi:hypothetical protein K2Z84_05185 [Candidatus Binatia bacterium]|nr:hypothetical protein [Candidatus Binatia bacterium]
MHLRDRVRELRLVPAGELRRNEKNWRRHPQRQRDALSAVLREIGYAGAVLAYEAGDELKLIDGHLRVDEAGEDDVPVLVVDLTEAEADRLLAIYDPLGAMAETDRVKLAGLLNEADQSITSLIHDLDPAGGAEPKGGGGKRPAPMLKFGDTQVALTEGEADSLRQLSSDYRQQHGSTIGFWGWLASHAGLA